MSNPYAKQLRLVQVINNSIQGHNPFFVCKTIEGKIQRLPIRMAQVDLKTGDLNIEYGSAEENHLAKATELDLKLISQQACQYDEEYRLEDEKYRLEEREEYQRRAKADFYVLGREMEKATTHEDLVRLGRQRAALAPLIGVSYNFDRYCWNCRKNISSSINAQCPSCRGYICSSCRACFC